MGNTCHLYGGHHEHQSGGQTHHIPTKDLSQIYPAYDADGVKLECCSLNGTETYNKDHYCTSVEQAMEECKKYNTEHEKYYCPVKSFSQEWLPCGFNSQDATKLIKALSIQTCLIKVSYVSNGRTVNDRYYKSRGENKSRVGSGFVHINDIDVKEMTDTDMNMQAPNGLSSGFSNAPVYGPFIVQTAKHLVYDESEMLKTKIYFHLDEDDESQAVEVIPKRVVGCYPSDDRIELECVTIDQTFGVKLQQAKSLRNELWRKFVNKPSNDEYQSEIIAVCISHIHGSNLKYISVGKCWEMLNISTPYEKYRTWRYFVYDTPTCCGSSGAPVWICKQDGNFHACVSHRSFLESNGDLLGQSSRGAIVHTTS